eukprot:s4524_g4.t1
MSLVLGVQGFESLAADAVDPDTFHLSEVSKDSNEIFWIWAVMFFMFALWMMFAVVAYFAWKRLSTDLYHCCNQVADEDYYAAQQAERIDLLTQRCERVETELEQNHAELGMGLVDLMNNGCVHLTILERANLISSRTGSGVEYMRLVRQRFAPEGPADATDENDNGNDGESSESEMVEDAEMEVPDASLASGGAHTLDETVEFLKAEHSRCPETNEFLGCQCNP